MTKNILLIGGSMLALLGLGIYQRNEQKKEIEDLRKRQRYLESVQDLFVELKDEQNEMMEYFIDDIRDEIADVYTHVEVLSDLLEIER